MKPREVTAREKSCISSALAQHFFFIGSTPTIRSAPAVRPSEPLSLPGFSFEWTASAAALPETWQALAPPDDLFLQLPYLEMLSEVPPADMAFQYLLFRYRGEPVGIACCQLLSFDAREHIRADEHAVGFWQRLSNRLRNALAARVRLRLLVCGNMLLTGPHGFSFASQITDIQAARLLEEALTAMSAHLNNQGQRVDGMMIKDLPPHSATDRFWKKRGFSPAPFQPNMVMTLPPQWQHFDDYLNALSSKYRVRARRAFKAAQGISLRELDASFLQENQQQIYDLYRHISGKAEFNMVSLHPQYFIQLAQTFPHRFKAKGYFRGEELLGFFTTILNGDELEAHFLGLRDEANTRYQLYLNMLYDIVRQGIEMGASRVVFSRTAMEIKSSVGASQQSLHCYLRHRCWWTNLVLPRLLRFLEPRAAWLERHPFKEVQD